MDSAGVKKTKNIKGKVKATVKHFKKSTGATLNLSYQIIDVNNGEMIFKGSLEKDSKISSMSGQLLKGINGP